MASTAAVKVAAPIVALTATFVGRKILEKVYEKSTGRAAPQAADPSVPLRNAMAFALAAAAIVTVTNVLVDRWVGGYEHPEAIAAEPA